SYRVSRPRASTFMPSRGRNARRWLLGLNSAQRTCARASFNVKYRCPEDGRETLPSSPSTSTSGKASSSRLRASVLSWLGLRISPVIASFMVGRIAAWLPPAHHAARRTLFHAGRHGQRRRHGRNATLPAGATAAERQAALTGSRLKCAHVRPAPAVAALP